MADSIKERVELERQRKELALFKGEIESLIAQLAQANQILQDTITKTEIINGDIPAAPFARYSLGASIINLDTDWQDIVFDGSTTFDNNTFPLLLYQFLQPGCFYYCPYNPQ